MNLCAGVEHRLSLDPAESSHWMPNLQTLKTHSGESLMASKSFSKMALDSSRVTGGAGGLRWGGDGGGGGGVAPLAKGPL